MSKWQENVVSGAGVPGAGPTGNVVNAVYIDTTNNDIYLWDGAAWDLVLDGGGSSITWDTDDNILANQVFGG